MLCRFSACLVLLPAALLCGCSNPRGVVTGKVSAEGKEVSAGGLVFSPRASEGNATPGPPSMVDLNKDGTYSLSVELGSGGPQRFAVRFTPRPSMGKGDVVPHTGLAPQPSEVEVKPGANVVNIELVPK